MLNYLLILQNVILHGGITVPVLIHFWISL